MIDAHANVPRRLQHGVLIAITTETSFAPNLHYPMATDVATDLQIVDWAPGTLTDFFAVTLDADWEAVVRYVDESYAKVQQCLALHNGYVEVQLQVRIPLPSPSGASCRSP